jgi:outer membrane cobalamin receptor
MSLLGAGYASAGVFGTVRGIIHDPSHRPVAGAAVALLAKASAYEQASRTDSGGQFEFTAVPAGEYAVRVQAAGFADAEQPVVIGSGQSPVLHIQLRLAVQTQSVDVSETPDGVNPLSSAPESLVTRQAIDRMPGAGLTNSLAMVTNTVPGAYMTHDQLHVRGGHQVTWAIDGVPIPNTNIASNVGPAIDPKDIDYLEVMRGGYSAEYGDRTYGVFNVVPRTGFERNREAEATTTVGTFHQTNDEFNLGDHSARFAWFAAVNGNRSDYGLETPGPEVRHDGVGGLGGFGSLIFNANPVNQFRFVTSIRRDDYQIPGGLDVERERDGVADFTWVHSGAPGQMWTVSPFFHFNRANYDGDLNASPVATTQHQDSEYAGAEAVYHAVSKRHDARAGVYGFDQRDNEFIGLTANDGSGASVGQRKIATGHLEAFFLEDQFKVTQWLALTGGIRLTHFSGMVSENAASPRIGAAVRIPRLNWVLRGFFGEYYQPPPLTTVSGPVLNYAVTQGLGVIPLRGERDQENQAGITIPLRGWTFDINSFRQRARNYFDHNALGNSNVFFPISIAGARIRGWETTVRSPRLFRRAEVSLVYSYQHAEAQGAVTGGLTDFSPPPSGYYLLDHDQRHTLHVNGTVNLSRRTWLALGMYYGSGFTDGASATPSHLQPHTTCDFSIGKDVGENWSVSVVGLNAANRRFLQDNSATFGGTHYADPRQVYVQLRYRFRF